MKISYLRAGVAALACVVGLAACGGGSSGQLLLGGTIIGVTKDGLILQNNKGPDYAPTASALAQSSGQFYFPELISIDASYDVTVKAVPTNVTTCDVTNGKGRAAFNVTSVLVVCHLKTHALHGNVTVKDGQPLTAGLQLVNGSDHVTVAANTNGSAIPFDMAPVGEDVPYGIAVLTQPDGLTCTVTNGTKTMGTTDVNDVVVNCVPRT
jgi:hypothetical protein